MKKKQKCFKLSNFTNKSSAFLNFYDPPVELFSIVKLGTKFSLMFGLRTLCDVENNKITLTQHSPFASSGGKVLLNKGVMKFLNSNAETIAEATTKNEGSKLSELFTSSEVFKCVRCEANSDVSEILAIILTYNKHFNINNDSKW